MYGGLILILRTINVGRVDDLHFMDYKADSKLNEVY